MTPTARNRCWYYLRNATPPSNKPKNSYKPFNMITNNYNQSDELRLQLAAARKEAAQLQASGTLDELGSATETSTAQ